MLQSTPEGARTSTPIFGVSICWPTNASVVCLDHFSVVENTIRPVKGCSPSRPKKRINIQLLDRVRRVKELALDRTKPAAVDFLRHEVDTGVGLPVTAGPVLPQPHLAETGGPYRISSQVTPRKLLKQQPHLPAITSKARLLVEKIVNRGHRRLQSSGTGYAQSAVAMQAIAFVPHLLEYANPTASSVLKKLVVSCDFPRCG